ncbi:MAG: SIS domain-containing protein, partial [Cellvibrionales bacterium]|nr:SIS domain-containing protein [Cellvibrionales bacterium]
VKFLVITCLYFSSLVFSNVERHTWMEPEARSTAPIVRFQLQINKALIKKVAASIKKLNPKHIYTAGRGSSKNACLYAELLLGKTLNIQASSIKLHEHSINNSQYNYANSLVIAISQSGRSRDIIQSVTAAKNNGAMVIAFVNSVDSPLAELADIVIPTHAGEEKSVAATKTFSLTLTAIAQLAAYLSESDELLNDLNKLSDELAQAWELDWNSALTNFDPSHSTIIVSRDIGLPIALEAALKLKETCGIHAEAYSAAEIRHGSLRLLLASQKLNILGFAASNPSAQSIISVIELARSQGCKVNLVSKVETEVNLPFITNTHPDLEPIIMIHQFYKLVNELARIKQSNPDSSPLLNKVTSTL